MYGSNITLFWEALFLISICIMFPCFFLDSYSHTSYRNTVKNKLYLQPEIFQNLLAVLFYGLLESTENRILYYFSIFTFIFFYHQKDHIKKSCKLKSCFETSLHRSTLSVTFSSFDYKVALVWIVYLQIDGIICVMFKATDFRALLLNTLFLIMYFLLGNAFKYLDIFECCHNKHKMQFIEMLSA